MMQLPKSANPKARRAVICDSVASMEEFRFPDGSARRVLNGVTLEVTHNMRFAIVGPVAYELKLLMEVMGSVRPYEKGRCSLMEVGMMRKKRRILSQVFYVSDGLQPLMHMRTLDYLLFASAKTGDTREDRQLFWLELMLSEKLSHLALSSIQLLSQAERAVIELMPALRAPASLVMVDFSSIEIPPSLFAGVAGIFRRLAEQEKTVIFATTQTDLAQAACDHAALIWDGETQAQDDINVFAEREDKRLVEIAALDIPRAIKLITPMARCMARGERVQVYKPETRPLLAPSDILKRLENKGERPRAVYICRPSFHEAYAQRVLKRFDKWPEELAQARAANS